MADDLHALLKASGIAPPYIVAGHSMGGIVARRFQSRHPEDVAGLLLIDSGHEDQARRLGDAGTWNDLKRAARRQLRVLGLRRIAAQLGRAGAVDAVSLNRETVPEYAGAAKAVTLSTKQRRTVVREILLLAFPARSAAEPRGAPADSAQRRQRRPAEVARVGSLVRAAG